MTGAATAAILVEEGLEVDAAELAGQAAYEVCHITSVHSRLYHITHMNHSPM